MRSLRSLVGLGSKNLAMPVNPLICQKTNTTNFIDPVGNRHLLKLDKPIPILLDAREELAPDTFVYRF
jgi:hypothetical protein